MAKYDSLRKQERNKLLKDYTDNHPNLSLKEIGELFGISASRVWHIIKRLKEQEAKGVIAK